MLKKKPFKVFCLPLWLLKGKAALKTKLAAEVTLDVTSLPYSPGLLAWLTTEKQEGRTLWLVTGSAKKIADAVQAHLQLFDEVHATDSTTNLTSVRKAAFLESKLGNHGFDYAGNSKADLPIWNISRKAYVVNAPASVARKAKAIAHVEHSWNDRLPLLKALLKAIRPHQWVKNILIFIPVVTSHQLMSESIMYGAAVGFMSFCLCTSSVYLLNDLLDLQADRVHPRKHLRPLAHGDLPIPVALFCIPLFFVLSAILALTVSSMFVLVLLAYVVATLAYSFALKQIPLVDVVMLAGLYTVRIIAGHAATGIVWSVWLLMFSMFFFFSLALVKRYGELKMLLQQNGQKIAGRGYKADDVELVSVLGVASGFIAVLVLALYITSDQVTILYRIPAVLWLLVPVMLYWVSRLWLLAHRGAVHDDPILFSLHDRVSYFLGGCIVAILLLAS